MFKKIKNIDTAFRAVRTLAIAIVVCCAVISSLALYLGYSRARDSQGKIYVLAAGKSIQAYSSDRKENLHVEARDHVTSFHKLFFTLSPDEKANRENIGSALYLADVSAKRVYDELREQGYYSRVVSGDLSQSIRIDSVWLDMDVYPYRFSIQAQQLIVRPTSKSTRSLITKGEIRQVQRSEKNSHGLLIERWEIMENNDLGTQTRRP